MGLWWSRRATKLEVLAFIREREVVGPMHLVDHFGYRYWGARKRLYNLSKQGLAVNIGVGEWTLTEAGYERLFYLKSREG